VPEILSIFEAGKRMLDIFADGSVDIPPGGFVISKGDTFLF